MMRRFSILLLTCALLGGAQAMVLAAPQEPPASPAPAAPPPAPPAPAPRAAPAPPAPPAPPAAVAPRPIRVDVLIQRRKGDQLVSSLPYTLVGLTGDGMGRNGLSLRLGSNVPVPMGASGSPVQQGVPLTQYQNVGTNIDCYVAVAPNGRYHVRFILEDSSVADANGAEAPTAGVTAPVFRSYRVTTEFLAKDGERQQVNVSTDKVSGETVVAEVTVTGL
jgi:hypothetical protein